MPDRPMAAAARRVADLLLEAAKSLRSQRLRAALSTVGVTVGTASVITILSLGAGTRDEILAQVESLGIQNVLLRTTTRDGTGGLVFADLERLSRMSTHVAAVAPRREIHALARSGERVAPVRVVGTTPALRAVADLPVSAGRFLVPSDHDERQPVCVLGREAADALFGFDDPVGRRVQIGVDLYEVVGVLLGDRRRGGPEPAAGRSGRRSRHHDASREIYVPIESVSPLAIDRRDWPLAELAISVASRDKVRETAGLVRAHFAETRRAEAAIDVLVPLELLDSRSRADRTLNLALGGVAVLSLLVGGIGIMNVMLATVTERTREIGIRRAVGASARDIALQFLAEAVLLTALGGFAGIAIGVAGSHLLAAVGAARVSIDATAIAAVAGVSVLWGILFGLHPAWQAARADPVDALRYE